jgi:glycosyltransferase involved in cell wall biosynthesis
MPFPPLDGGAQVMHYTTRGLMASHIEVKVLAINPTRNLIDVGTLPDEYRKSTRFESVTVDTRIKPVKVVINLFGKESYFIQRFISKDFEHKLKVVFESDDYDIIQLEHLYLCKYIATIRKYSGAKIILRPQNIEYVIWERYLKGLKNPLKKWFLDIAVSRLKIYEQSVNGQLDGIIALTNEDAALFSSFPEKTPIVVVPMGYDYDNLKGYDFQNQYEIPPVVYHLGSMDWLPNLEAVTWFFEYVYPIIIKRGCPVKFSIAGSNMPSWVYKYQSENMEILGTIKKPLEYQADKSVMMVPLWSGSGIRAKIIEGLALGKTIISTTIGAQGIEYEVGKNILIADTPSGFAEQIIQCFQTPGLCRKIGCNARKLSESQYHFMNTAKKMVGFYKQLLEGNV